MKKSTIISFFLLFSFLGYSQSYQELNINNVRAGFNAAGDMLYNPNPLSQGFYFNNQVLQLCAANLWIGGFGQNHELYISAQTYRQTGDDFWSGPLDTSGNAFCESSRNIFYDKVWKLNCSEVDSFFAYLQSQAPAGYYVPMNFQNWPGNGDPLFAEDQFLAPFVDSDGDGFYSWTAGDYPLIKGQQALYYVYNDSLENTSHTQTNGRSMGLEIQVMPYAFNLPWNNSVSNAIFIHYTIINRSAITYDSTIVGFWNDINLGSIMENHSGSDSALNSYFTYDSTLAVGVVFLNQSMSGFITYNNDGTVMGNPSTPEEYYQYLQQRWRDNSPMTYGGNAYGGTNATNYIYSGNPATGIGWNETSLWGQRNIGSAQSFTFLPGMSYSFDIAIVLAEDSFAPYACVTSLKQSIQDVRNFYANENQFCIPGLTEISEFTVSARDNAIFPNPASSQITIQSSSFKPQTFSIIDVTGKLLVEGELNGKETNVDVSELPAGVYFIRVENDESVQTLRFVKGYE